MNTTTTTTTATAAVPFRLEERAGAMLGVPGRFYAVSASDAAGATFINQTWRSEGRAIRGYGAGAMLTVEARFDDHCRNGHNTFTITAEVRRPRARDVDACGCLHDDIAKVFPELSQLIRWHLVSADGPMHYVANTVFHAGDRDHNGLRKGEKRPLVGPDGQPHYTLRAIVAPGVAISAAHLKVSRDGKPYEDGDVAPLHALDTRHKGEGVPVAPALVWVQEYREGEGKARDLAAARSCACWPNATDAELSVEPAELREKLTARLPLLMGAFKGAMRGAGFLYSPVDAA